MNSRLTIGCIVIALAFWMAGCRVPKDINPVKQIQPPGYFRADTGYMSRRDTIKWHDYFHDPNLTGLIDTALHYNIDMQIANQRIFAANAAFLASRNALFPQVYAAGTVGVAKYGDYTMNGVGNFDTNLSPNISSDQQIPNPTPDYYLGLRAGWETGIWGKLQNRKRGQFNRFLASQLGKKLLTTQLVAEVAMFYYELLALDTELEIIRRNIGIQEKAVEIIHIQKASGRITELGVRQFEAQLLRSKALEGLKLQEIIAAENAMNTLLGRYPQRIFRKDTIDMRDLPPMLNTGIPSELLLNRPDIQQAEREFIATDYELKSVRAAFYPSIIITADAGMNAFKSSLWFQAPASFAYGVIGGLSAPLINRNQIMVSYRRAYAERNAMFLEYQRTVLRGVEEVSTEMNRVLNYRRVSDFKAQEVRTLIEAVDISNELFLTGYANYMEVLIARQNRLESELQFTEVRKQQFLSAIFLYRALGGGWE